MSSRPPDDDPDAALDEGDDAIDNVIPLRGLIDRLPEPSPRRAGGPGRAAEDQPDGLEEVQPGDRPPEHLMEAAVEAILFAADQPLSEARIDAFLSEPGLALVREALAALKSRYDEHPGGIRLVQAANGWQLRTDPRFARWVGAMLGGRPVRLSRAALEVLAIVAYRQPVSRAEVDELRGVDSGAVLRMLVERGLVQVNGRRDEPGRPLLYGSTSDFLSMFSLRDLSDLPTLRDLHEIQHDDPRLGPLAELEPRQQHLPLAVARPPIDEGAGQGEALRDGDEDLE